MPRFFSLDEAHSALPAVETALRDALFLKAEYSSTERDLKAIMQQVYLMGGVRLDSAKVLAMRARKDTAAAGLKSRFEELSEMGVLVKDLDIGLIDFPTLYHGSEVYLCWRMGEERIAFWHSVEEGFGGRKQIDDEFLQNHTGSSV